MASSAGESGSEDLHISSESSYQDLLLKIIEELEAKNSILIENSSLLKDKITYLENEISDLKKIVNIREERMITDIASEPTYVPVNVSEPKDVVSFLPRNVSEPKNVVTNDSKKGFHDEPKVPKSKIASASINNVQNITKNTINRDHNSDIHQNGNKPESNTSWQTVTSGKKRKSFRRALVVGNYSRVSNIEGIEKYKPLHVTNLKPDTTAEELLTFLQPNFTDAKCEALKSKYPESYSSFKVLIAKSQFEKALDPSC